MRGSMFDEERANREKQDSDAALPDPAERASESRGTAEARASHNNRKDPARFFFLSARALLSAASSQDSVEAAKQSR